MKESLTAIAIAASMIVVIGIMFSIPVMLLWNWLCPMLFHFPHITVLQAWGLLLLSGFLFKNSSTSSD